MPNYNGLLSKYGHLLDLPAHTKNITLLEGNTPPHPRSKTGSQFGGRL